MDIQGFKDENPAMYERLVLVTIKFYEEKRYRDCQADVWKVERGVEIEYL